MRYLFIIMGLMPLYAMGATWPTDSHNPFALSESSPIVMSSKTVQLHYLSVKSAVNLLKPITKKFSSQELLIPEPVQHRLWISATRQHLSTLQHLLNAFDQPREAVMLKARIVSVDHAYERQLGALFSTHGHEDKTDARDDQVTLPIANLNSGQVLDVTLSALEHDGHARVMSSPQMMTLNHQTASIESGEEVPYQQETSNGGTSVAFKKAVMRLAITPHVVDAGRVLLDVHINQDKVSALTVQGVPAIHTQQLTTQVLLKNHQTVAIGGIYESVKSTQSKGVPGLKRVPIIGGLFRHHAKVDDRRELVIFLTVSVVRS